MTPPIKAMPAMGPTTAPAIQALLPESDGVGTGEFEVKAELIGGLDVEVVGVLDAAVKLLV